MTANRPGWMLVPVEATEEMLANTVDDRGRPLDVHHGSRLYT